jgi:uncharacterized damage-inducible protein DinB
VIEAAHLFPPLHARLSELLRALEPHEWDLPTVAGAWSVRDVAAHLLDTQQRLVDAVGPQPAASSAPVPSNAALVALIDRLNAEGVQRYRLLETADLIARLVRARRSWPTTTGSSSRLARRGSAPTCP